MAGFEWNWEMDVLQNLNEFLGIDLRYVLGIPKNPIVGDRMLCLLRGGHKTAQLLGEEIASRWQINQDVQQRPAIYPHVAALPGKPPEKIELRITDVMGDLCFWRGQRQYLQSFSLLPEDDWIVQWALGAIFLADRRIMVYGDFRHPRVKLIFTESFFVGGEPEEVHKKRISRLLERLQGALTLKNRYGGHEAYKWAKIINACDGPQWIALMDRDDKLSIEEIPYPDAE